jgi:hypothetical protein
MVYEYGQFTEGQIAETKHLLQKKIFFLLLIVDPKTRENFETVDVPEAFDEILRMLSGFNKLLNYPAEVVDISCKLEAAREEYNKGHVFDFMAYRRLILGAGKEVEKIKEV